jgi:hypothetical protein
MLGVTASKVGYNLGLTEVLMSKILMAILVSLISLSSFACGGGKDEEKKTELIVERSFF